MDGKIIQEPAQFSGLKVLRAEYMTESITLGFDTVPLFCTISVDNTSSLMGAIIYLPLLSADQSYLIDQSATSANVSIVRYSTGTIRIQYRNRSNPLLVTFLGY